MFVRVFKKRVCGFYYFQTILLCDEYQPLYNFGEFTGFS